MSAEALREKIREIPDFPKPGILFYDITTLLKDPAAYKEAIDLMLEPYKDEQVDIVVGMESRGFIFSAPMAYQLDAGLVPVRKLGKLPAETITVEYALEYGSNTLEIHRDAIQPGQKVLIVDDLLATGGTVKGTIELIERLKGEVVGLGFLVELEIPQGSRPAGRTPGHQRHPVLSDPLEARTRFDRRRPTTRPPAAEPTPRRPPGGGADLARRRFFRQFAGELFHGAARRGRRGPGAPAGLRRGGRRDPRPELVASVGPRPRRSPRAADRLPDAVPRDARASSTSSTSASCPTCSRSTRPGPRPRWPTRSAR